MKCYLKSWAKLCSAERCLCWFWSRAGLWLGALVEQQLCFGARAAGRAAASGSGSNRAAFVSRGCWEPCDQSCHSHFGQTTRGDWREGGTGGGGERGSVWEDVEVANPPSLPPSPPLSFFFLPPLTLRFLHSVAILKFLSLPVSPDLFLFFPLLVSVTRVSYGPGIVVIFC